MDVVLPVFFLLEFVPVPPLLRSTGLADLLRGRKGYVCRLAYAGSDHVGSTPCDLCDVLGERAGVDGVGVDDERSERSVHRKESLVDDSLVVRVRNGAGGHLVHEVVRPRRAVEALRVRCTVSFGLERVDGAATLRLGGVRYPDLQLLEVCRRSRVVDGDAHPPGPVLAIAVSSAGLLVLLGSLLEEAAVGRGSRLAQLSQRYEERGQGGEAVGEGDTIV